MPDNPSPAWDVPPCPHGNSMVTCKLCHPDAQFERLPEATVPRVYAMSTAIQRVVDELRELPPDAAGRVLIAAAVILGREDLAKAMLGRDEGLAEVLGVTPNGWPLEERD